MLVEHPPPGQLHRDVRRRPLRALPDGKAPEDGQTSSGRVLAEPAQLWAATSFASAMMSFAKAICVHARAVTSSRPVARGSSSWAETAKDGA